MSIRKLCSFSVAILAALGAVLAGPAGAGAAQPARGDVGAVPGEVIVRFEDGADVAAHNRALAGIAVENAEKLALPRTVLVSLGDGVRTARAIATLESHPAVAYAEPNAIRHQRATPDDPFFPELWGMEAIGAPTAWDSTTGSVRSVLAIADDGIDLAHPDLTPNIWVNTEESALRDGVDDDQNGFVDDRQGWDFVDDDNWPAPQGKRAQRGDDDEPDPRDLPRHGTHIAGTIGARGNNGIGGVGVNWTTQLMALRIFDERGETSTDRIVNAFEYAGQNGARAVNVSFGGSNPSQAEQDTIGRWSRMLFVAAAPNEKMNVDEEPDFPCSYSLANVICVTAADEKRERASFAARGPGTIALAAPGKKILSTVPGGYDEISGTSMAAPHVTGAVGLIAALRPRIKAAGLRDALIGSALRNPELLNDVSAGHLDVAGAISRALNARRGKKNPPRTWITRGAKGGRTSSRRPTFGFRSNHRTARFLCRVNRGRWRRCTSPHKTGRLARGKVHRFRVRAIDPDGTRDRTPAKRRFLVRRR